MEIVTYQARYQEQAIDLILSIQNGEAGIGLSLAEQPDLLDIPACYQRDGGEFWLAVEDGAVVGTLALMKKGEGRGVLKKFFVRADHRGQKVGLQLYRRLLDFAQKQGIVTIVLDTPSVARASHQFYERAGFRRIGKEELPFPYEYPDRDSYLYLLKL